MADRQPEGAAAELLTGEDFDICTYDDVSDVQIIPPKETLAIVASLTLDDFRFMMPQTNIMGIDKQYSRAGSPLAGLLPEYK